MKMRILSAIVMMLIGVFCSSVVFAQSAPLSPPAAISRAREQIRAQRETVTTSATTLAEVAERTHYTCIHAEALIGTKLILVPNVGMITAYSTVIGKPHVTAYWKEYHAVEGAEIQNWNEYADAVAYLNPQISDIDRICKGYLIRLPSVTNARVVVVDKDKQELQNLRTDVAQLGMLEAATQRSLTDLRTILEEEWPKRFDALSHETAALRKDVTQTTATVSTLVRSIETLEEALEAQKQDVADTKQLVIDLTQKVHDLSSMLATTQEENKALRAEFAASGQIALRGAIGLLLVVALAFLVYACWVSLRRSPKHGHAIDVLRKD